MKIINKGIIEGYNEAENNELSSNAIKYIDPEAMNRYRKGTALYSMWAGLVPIFLFSIKYIETKELFMPFCLLGIVLGCIMLLPKELIKAILYPHSCTVSIYQILNPPKMFVTTDASISKYRYIAISICPSIVLGLIPIIVWFFVPQELYLARTLFSIGFINIVTGGYDYMCAVKTISRVPKNFKVRLNGAKVFYQIS